MSAIPQDSRKKGHVSAESGAFRPVGAQSAEQAALAARVFDGLPFVMPYSRREDDNWTLESVGRGSRTLIGFEADDLSKGAVSYLDLVHPEDRERVRHAMETELGASGAFEVTYRLRGINGAERTVVDRGYRVSHGHAPPLVEGFIARDVGSELGHPSASDEIKLRVLAEQSLAGIYLIRDGRFSYVNPRFAEIFGYSPREIVALPSVLDLVHPDHGGLVAHNLQRRMAGQLDQIRYEFTGRTKRGEAVEVEAHGSRIEVGNEPCVFGVLLDVSEHRRAERLARTTEKLDALRRLASGVAHDLNNFLSTIRSTAEVLGIERADDAELAVDLKEIVQAVERGTTLSRQLAGFGRVRDPGEAVASPSEVLTDLASHLRPLLGSRIELKTDIADGLPTLPLGSEALHDAVMDLVLNAQDAMPTGGALTIRAHDMASSGHVMIEVSDTGAGVPPSIRPHLFEPHFGTKGEQGTGLELPNVRRVVSEAQGSVEIGSVPGEGSTFRILLPHAPTT